MRIEIDRKKLTMKTVCENEKQFNMITKQVTDNPLTKNMVVYIE